MNRAIHILLAFTLALTALGCETGGNPVYDGEAQAPPQEARERQTMVEGEYRLRRGDVLEVRLAFNPELNQIAPIRPDGRLSLPRVGEVVVAGRTPGELQTELAQRYAAAVPYPDVSVVVLEFAQQQVYVGGEVRTPGLLDADSNLTALQAIMQAGGFLETAETKNVVILRYQGTPKPLFMTIDLKDVLLGDGEEDLVLAPLDIVFVPKSRIAKFDQFIDEYLRQVIPVNLTLGAFYDFAN